MSTTQITETIRSQIAQITEPVFKNLGFTVSAAHVWNDIARFGKGLEATFYVDTIENVDRKSFAAQAQALKEANKCIVEFKVQSKRPGKNVRFYLKVTDDQISA